MVRFSTEQDYSQTFMYLYDQNARALEAKAQRIDSKRETELAARDALIFTKWQEGKISGDQLMAHIRTRMNQTYYDKAQQLKWREAAIEYGNVIADEKAEAAYAESGNISGLIAHYASRLAGTKGGTPERRELAERLRSLREKRDSDNLRRKGRRIARAIERGDMSTRDLINFYKGELPGLKGDLREQVLDTLAELRGRLRQENFEVAMQKIDNELATGHISPQDAARQKIDVLKKFDIEQTDQVGYQKWLEQIRTLRATPDPAEVEKLDFDMAAGNITPEQYIAQINKWADQIAPYDQAAAWQLRSEAQSWMEKEATPLDDPTIIGGYREQNDRRGFSGTVDVVKKLRGNAIKHITQMDGSAYSQYNCTMASAAMLAHSMGFTGLSGADVRALAGVTSQATNLVQAYAALTKAGVKGLNLSYDNRIEFERFKQRLANGASASLSGWNGDIPSQFNASGIIGGHNVFVATYDPKRDAFLVLDPAKSRDQGTWWPASILEDFGWGGQRHGQAMFSPRGTVDPRTLKRAGGKVRHINVNAKPMRPTSPPMTQFDPGPRATNQLGELMAKNLRIQKERLNDGGVTEKERRQLTTEQRVESLIDERGEKIADLQAVLDQIDEQVQKEGEFSGEIELLGTGDVFSREDIAQMQKQLIYMYDAQSVLYEAVGNKEKARDQKNLKDIVLIGAAALNSLEDVYLTNQQVSEANKIIRGLGKAESPEEFLSEVKRLRESIEVIATINDHSDDAPQGKKDKGPRTKTDDQAERVDTVGFDEVEETLAGWDKLIEALNGDYSDPSEMIEAVTEAAEELDFAQTKEGAVFIRDVVSSAAQADALEAGEAVMVLAPEVDEQGTYVSHQLIIVPTKESQQYDPETGEFEDVIVPDLSVLGPDMIKELSAMGYDASTLPQAQLPSGDGVERIPVIPARLPYEGVKMLAWGDVTAEQFAQLQELGLTEDQVTPGSIISEDALSALATDPNAIPILKAQGLITDDVPWPVQQVNWQDRRFYLDQINTPEGIQGVWHEGNLPYVARVKATDGLDRFYSDYFGGAITPDGRVWIDYTPASGDEIDDTDTGSPLINLGVTSEQARDDIAVNGGTPTTVYARNPEDPATVEPITPSDPRHPDNPTDWGLKQFLRDQDIKHKMMADKVAQGLPPEEAAESSLLSKFELREKARSLGIDPENPEETPGIGGTRRVIPGEEILQELAVAWPGGRTEGDSLVGQDHLEAARARAKSLDAKRREERAAALAAAKEAQLAARQKAMALDRVTAPGGSKTPLPGAGVPAPTSRPKSTPRKDSPSPPYKPPPPPRVNRTPTDQKPKPAPPAPKANQTDADIGRLERGLF